MEYRNAQVLEDGRIDCEVNYPEFGWAPITLSADDTNTKDLHAEIVAAGTATPFTAPDPAIASTNDEIMIVNGKIASLKELLSGSDYWELPSYMEEHTPEVNDAKKAQRKAWRAEIRTLEATLYDLTNPPAA